MAELSLRTVAFLDTNVLHFIGLYLREATDHDLFPFDSDSDIAAAKEHLKKRSESGLRKSLEKGLNVTVHLLEENIRVQYSSVSELELIVGRARGKAIENAAAEGIPDRMWTRLYDKEVGNRLLGDDLTAIRTTVDQLGPMLKEAGIDATVEKSEHARDVLEVAKDVTGLVYMSVVDSIIYAGALVAEADRLISDDNYLTTTVKRIKDDASLRGQLEQRLAVILSRRLDAITLPDATGIPADGR